MLHGIVLNALCWQIGRSLQPVLVITPYWYVHNILSPSQLFAYSWTISYIVSPNFQLKKHLIQSQRPNN